MPRAVASAWLRPLALSSMSMCPWMRRSAFQSVSPWRTIQSRVVVTGARLGVWLPDTRIQFDANSNRYREAYLRALLALSRLIDALNERVGKLTSWLVLAAALLSATNAVLRK